MRRVDKRAPEWLVGHTHDELLLEVPEAEADRALALLLEEMRRVPTWAEGMPLDASHWTGTFYRKD